MEFGYVLNHLVIKTNVKPSDMELVKEEILKNTNTIYIECDIICSDLILFIKANKYIIKSNNETLRRLLIRCGMRLY